MAKAVGNHVGTFDQGAVQDVIYTDAQQGPLVYLTGSADQLTSQGVQVGTSLSGNILINSSGVDAIVLSAPVAGTDDNTTLQFQDIGGHAHTITSTGNLVTNSASVNVATFSGNKGANLYLRAIGGKWYVLAAIGITFS